MRTIKFQNILFALFPVLAAISPGIGVFFKYVITLLDNCNANKTVVKKILGHAGLGTTEKVYTHKTVQQLVEAKTLLICYYLVTSNLILRCF